jgi:RimJ/RimL family protein N-acetyltransferase
MAEFAIETPRLTLRACSLEDLQPLHAICNDPLVMRFLGPHRSEAEIEHLIIRQQALQAEFGHCFWAVERREDKAMIGLCGLLPGPAKTPLEGRIEIGWRLASDCWGKGYARDAALAALAWGWANLKVADIWAITVQANERSWGLMQRLGMTRHADLDFDHPNVPDDSPLKRHVTWSIARV